MFGFIYRVAIGVVLAGVLGLNSVCFASFAKSTEKVNGYNQTLSGNPWKVSFHVLNVEENNSVETNTTANVEESSVLVGVWRASMYMNGMRCNSEVIFQPNGGYSSLIECGNGTYMFRTVGYWYLLQQGAVRIQYTDYSPKEYGGNPIRIPDGETVYFRVINRNQVESSLGMLYRVG